MCAKLHAAMCGWCCGGPVCGRCQGCSCCFCPRRALQGQVWQLSAAPLVLGARTAHSTHTATAARHAQAVTQPSRPIEENPTNPTPLLETKVLQASIRLGVRKHFLSERTARQLHGLPREVVPSPSLELFKNHVRCGTEGHGQWARWDGLMVGLY